MFVYDIERCTTEQLRTTLSRLQFDGWEPYQPTYVGGRDWVIVCRREAEDVDLSQSERIAPLREEKERRNATRGGRR